MRGKSGDIGLLPVLLTLIVILLLAIAAVALLLWPLLTARLAPLPNQTVAANASPAVPPDAALYYRLKNLSCQTLSRDFLIVTEDRANGTVIGLHPAIPQEAALAQSFASAYDYAQTTRTYVKGEEMKKVISSGNDSLTLIWKEGRLYQCDGNCTMRLLGDQGWQAYLDSLSSMRSGCAYFGRTALPSSVNASRLLQIRFAQRSNISGFICDDFLLTPDRQYAASLLQNQSLSSDQQALLWGLAHSAGPVEECLDEGTGIVVFRDFTLDLSKVYMFSYDPGGGMFVDQQTRMTYFTGNVPESFLSLPG